jgi:hemoglobin-like flavoprotein
MEVQSSWAACSTEPQAVKPVVKPIAKKTVATQVKRNFDDFITQV